MRVVLLNTESKTLVVIDFQNAEGSVVEDSFGGYDYAPVSFEYDNRDLDPDFDDPYYDWEHGAISLLGEDGTDLTGFEEADYSVIYDTVGQKEADYYQAVYVT